MTFLPKIEKFEFNERRNNLRHLMKLNNLDFIIAYADDRATFGQQFSRYYFNYQPHFEPACLVIPIDTSSYIITGPESEEFVLNNSYCNKVLIADVFTHPDEEYPYHDIEKISDLIQLSIKKKSNIRIGIAGQEMMPYDILNTIKNIDKVETLNVNQIILEQRSIKSNNEIDVIKHCYLIAEKGIKRGIEVIEKGINERKIAAEIEYVMRKNGSEGMGIDTIVGSGKQNTRPILTRTTFREIVEGDHVLLTIAPRYEGYHGAIGRVVGIGEIDNNIANAYKIATEAQELVIDKMKPGETGKNLDKIARSHCEKNNFKENFAYSGIHSVGVCEFEYPIMTSWYENEIKENMILSIDIPLFFHKWGGLRIEDGFRITNNSNEKLQSISKELIIK